MYVSTDLNLLFLLLDIVVVSAASCHGCLFESSKAGHQPSMSIATEITSSAVAFLSFSVKVCALQNASRASSFRFR